MAPVPQIVIASSAATRKGQITVGSVEDIDELISQLIIAKTGIIGARGAMDAAREVETSRQAAITAEPVTADADTWTAAEPALCGHPRNADGECGAACDVPAPLATVTTLVPAAERQADARFTVAGPAPVTVLINGEPVEVQPCPNVYPETGEPCIGLFDHEPPCRGVEAGEWVPAVTPVTA